MFDKELAANLEPVSGPASGPASRRASGPGERRLGSAFRFRDHCSDGAESLPGQAGDDVDASSDDGRGAWERDGARDG